MKYYQVDFKIEPKDDIAADVLSALLADAGFEAFDGQLSGWVQQCYFNEDAVDGIIHEFPLPGYSIIYNVKEAADENWNEKWEREGFEPIVLDDLVVVHDSNHNDVPEAKYDIRINPCMAFGTGSHQTTRLILRQLAELDLTGLSVIDAGTGTGILAIMSSMLGAEKVFAYDIDEWSVRNAQGNCQLNNINNVEIRHGDSSVIDCDADILIANINRNILLADLPVFSKHIKPEGMLLLSGFYSNDVPLLIERASALGFQIETEQHDEDWTMLLLKKKTENSPLK